MRGYLRKNFLGPGGDREPEGVPLESEGEADKQWQGGDHGAVPLQTGLGAAKMGRNIEAVTRSITKDPARASGSRDEVPFPCPHPGP